MLLLRGVLAHLVLQRASGVLRQLRDSVRESLMARRLLH